MKKRLMSLLLAAALVIGMLPTAALAAETEQGRVRVVVENTTFTSPVGGKTPAWTGTKADVWVNIDAQSTMMSCVAAALTAEGIACEGAESGYLTSVGGLAAYDGGASSGWMGTVNDWFSNEGMSTTAVEDGDEIRLMYTCDWGADLGSDWSSNEKTLSTLTTSAGSLTPAFDSAVKSYTLRVPSGTTGVVLTPAASNKNFQVHTSVGAVEYKRTRTIPVEDGTVITVTCGNPEWPTMNTGASEVPAETYTITVAVGEEAQTADVIIRTQMAGGYLSGFGEAVRVSANLAEDYGYQDSVDGVSALDALVKAHQLVFGEEFTPETGAAYLAVSSSGFVSMLFGVETYANGFFLNQGCPNDGTKSEYGGYNGTTVATQVVKTGDVVDFFLYQDDAAYSDFYTWAAVEEPLISGAQATVTLSGLYASSAYLYQTPAALQAAAKPLEDAQLAWVDTATGAVEVIEGARSDGTGKLTFTVNRAAGEYALTAVSCAEEEIYVLMNPVQVTVMPAPEPTSVQITMNAVSTTAKLYAAADGAHARDFLSGVAVQGTTYNVSVPAGDYLLECIATDGVTSNGSILLTVEDGEENSFRVWTVTAYCKDSGWTYGTDYVIEDLLVRVGGGGTSAARTVTLGDSVTAGRKTFPVLNGDSYTFCAVPQGARTEGYAPAVKRGTVTRNSTVSFSIPERTTLTVTYPYADANGDRENDYVLEVGQLSSYFTYTYAQPDSVAASGVGRVTAVYSAAKGETYFYRVSNPFLEDAVTYGSYVKSAGEDAVEVTAADLRIGGGYDKGTVIDDFSVNKLDTGDLYLTVNPQGHLNLAPGESWRLYPYRSWLAVEGTANAKVIEPDFHVQVVAVEGNDVIRVEEHTDDDSAKHSYTITAQSTGTAIVLVTYDAMTNAQGQAWPGSGDPTFFSAIWPENTGVFVVTVGGDTGVETGMTINEGKNTPAVKLSGDQIDSELDVLYYTGDRGACYTFTPESGATVTMAVGRISGGTLTFGDFCSTGVTRNPDGSVTLSGLTGGKSIVRIEKDGKVAYQVLRAKKLDYDVYLGTAADEDNLLFSTKRTVEHPPALQGGDEVLICFDTLYHPANKLSGIYNMSASGRFVGEDGAEWQTGSNQYAFASTAAAQQMKLTIPENWTGSTYSVQGSLCASGYGSAYGMHRTLTYEAGRTANFTAAMQTGYFGQLPAITLQLSTVSSADALERVLAYLRAQTPNPTVGVTGGEWAVLALARGGVEDETWYSVYRDNVRAYVGERDGKLSPTDYQYTEYSRVVLALTALGEDAAQFQAANGTTYDLTAPLLARQAGSGQYYPMLQGNNGIAFALLALDSGAYHQADGMAARAACVDALLAGQLADGMWGVDAEHPQPSADTTAMILQALAPYYGSAEKFAALGSTYTGQQLADAVSRALEALKGAAVGGDWGSAETASQILVALSALKIDAADGDWNLMDTLLRYFDEESGGFRHTREGTVDQIASEQAAYALVAYDRFATNRNSLYDMTDVRRPTSSTAQDVMQKIDAIGTVTEDSYHAITAARAAYNALSAEERARVTNYGTLEAAEAAYTLLLSRRQAEAIRALRACYDRLLEENDYLDSARRKLLDVYLESVEALLDAASCQNVQTLLAQGKRSLEAVDERGITVTFRLIGDTDHADGTAGHTAYLTWVPTRSYEVSADATVYDLYVEAMGDAGLSSKGAGGNYISAVTAPKIFGGYTLGEFTNGKNSGWMYTVNGDHPDVGIRNYTLEDGDEVIVHYVDDYARETSGSAADRERWLEAEDISPETYCRRHIDEVVTCGRYGVAEPVLTVGKLNRDVTFTFRAEEGYRVAGVVVDGREIGAVEQYTYEDLSIFSRIEVKFARQELPFTDVGENDWFYEDVAYVYRNGLFSGTGDETFSPNEPMTRAMLVTVLYRMEGQPGVSGPGAFRDVVPGAYYEDAVLWAAENDIVQGTAAGNFAPDTGITREQLAAVLYRYAAYKGDQTAETQNLDRFSDRGTISDYALRPVEWAVGCGLMNGTGDRLSPAGGASRAQVAAVLHRFAER